MPFLRSLSLRLIEKGFYLLFFLVPLVMTPLNYELFEFNKMILVYGLTALITGSWLALMITEKRVIFRRTFWDIPLLLFLGSQILSWFFSIDRHTSFFGYYSRFHGGLASTLSYALLYWTFVSFTSIRIGTNNSRIHPRSKNNKLGFNRIFIGENSDKINPFAAKCLTLLLASGLLVSLYGIAEHFGIDAKYWVQDVQNRVFSTLGQPNWLAAWLAAIIPLTWAIKIANPATSKPINSKTNKFSLSLRYPLYAIPYTLFAIFYLCLLFTKSRSGLAAFGASFLVFWGISFLSLLKKSSHKSAVNQLSINCQSTFNKLFIIFGLLFFVSTTIVGTPWTPSFNRLLTKDQPIAVPTTTRIANYGEGTESGAIRTIVWRGALELWQHHPLLGTGPETFAYAYYQYRPREHNDVSEWDFLFNKAHNEYLNMAANTGTLGLATYLVLIVSFSLYVAKISKSKFLISNKNSNYQLFTPQSLSEVGLITTYGLFSGWLSILITNFFGFSVVAVGLLFFLFPALAVSLTTADTPQPPPSLPKPGYRQYLLASVFVFLTLFTGYYLLNYWRADFYFAEGEKLTTAGQYELAVATLQKAVRLRPAEPFYHDSLAIAAAQLAATSEDPSAFAALAVDESDRTVRLNPHHLNFWKNRVRVFYTLAETNPNYYQESYNSLLKAKELAPTDAKIYYNLALLYARLEQEDLAVQTLEETIRLKPNYDTARYALALFYEKQDKEDLAQTQYRYILENINPEHEGAKEKLLYN